MKRLGGFVARWYFAFVLALWVLSPELRRLVDWETSFHKVSLFSILPLVAMLPGVFYLVSRWRAMGDLYRKVGAFWLVGFGYAFIIALAAGSRVSALYDALTFLLPVVFGVFLAAQASDARTVCERLSRTLLWLAAATSAYAVYQYVSPPPWDVYWVQNADLASIGQPIPFGLRVFGTLNSYGTFAQFVSLSMVFNLPRLRWPQWKTVCLYVPCALALVLTLDRTSWLALAIGCAVYVMASPERSRAVWALVSIAVFCSAVGGGLLAVTQGSSDVTSIIQQRFSSLGDLSEDSSVASRQQQTSEALHDGLAEPLGQGLGQIGTASVAGSSGSTNTLDNGYLARFVELGLVGFAAYLVAICLAFAGTFSTYRSSLRAPQAGVSNVLAMTLAVQTMFLVIETSTDTHNSFLGVIFWSTLLVASRLKASVSAGRPARAGMAFEMRPAAAS
ncbi:MAG: O-antigen ligase family protein [Vulcanimicrobiaceae bacterium]